MPSVRGLFTLLTAVLLVHEVQAVEIGLGDFSGSETVVSLANLPGPSEPVVVVGDLTFTSTANFLKQAGLSETSQAGSFTMDLANPQQRVGVELNAFSTATDGTAITWSVEAFDAGLSSLETVLLSQSAASNPVFGGIERSEGIARLLITEVTPHPNSGSNYFTFINEVRYEAIPEPAAIWLLTLGWTMQHGLATRRKRQRRWRVS